MAKTLIGRLQLIVDTIGLGNAQKVEHELDRIGAAAKRLSSAPWGAGFQRQLDRLKLAPAELAKVQSSWTNLEKVMGGDGKANKRARAAWQISVLGNAADLRKAMADRENMYRTHVSRLQHILKPVMVAGGAYTLAYGGGMALRGALTAGSEEARAKANQNYAGLSDDEKGKINAKADEISTKYRMSKADSLDMLKESTLSMRDVDAAMAVADANARAMLVLDTMFGQGAGKAGVRSFSKGMDLLARQDPKQYAEMMDSYVRAQQVLGVDLDPEKYYEALKYSRQAGKFGSDEFMSKILPMIVAEQGISAGTMLKALNRQTIGGKASRQAKAAQTKYGLRGKDGKMVEQDLLAANPAEWLENVLKPMLEKQGVNIEDKAEFQRVISSMFSNEVAVDAVISMLMNAAQYGRLGDRMDKAAGLDAATDIQKLDPFAAFEGFKNSLSNLSAAVLPMTTIGEALNTFADRLNGFTQKVRDGTLDWETGGVAAGAGLAGAVVAGKTALGIWNLATAGTSLQTAATMLMDAAAMQGSGVAGAAGLAGGKKGFWSKARKVAGYVPLAAAIAEAARYAVEQTSADVAAENKKPAYKTYDQGDDANRENYRRMFGDVPFEGGMHRVGRGAGPAPGMISPAEALIREIQKAQVYPIPTPRPEQASTTVDATLTGMDKVRDDAAQAGADIQRSLSVAAAPTVDQGSIQSALAAARELASVLTGIGASAHRAAANVDAQLRRVHADLGGHVAP